MEVAGQTSPSIDNAALLAKFYKVSLDELYGIDKATTVIDVAALSKKQIAAIKMIVECFWVFYLWDRDLFKIQNR